MYRYDCGCQINWSVGPPPRRCPAHWLQERVSSGDRRLKAELAALRPRRLAPSEDRR